MEVSTESGHMITNPHTSTAQVSVTVMDVNDNKPVFLQDPYITSVTEGDDERHIIQVSYSC